MIRLTITLDMPDWWGADEAFADAGANFIKELIQEDLSAFWEDAENCGMIVVQKLEDSDVHFS